MKIIPFTIPIAETNSVVVQEDILPHFYHHLHRHKEAQITWIQKGTGTLIVGNYIQPFKEGDVYILGANQAHLFKSNDAYFKIKNKLEVQSLTIFFNPDGFFKPLLNLPEFKSIKQFVAIAENGLQLPQENTEPIKKQLLKLKIEKKGYLVSGFILLLQMLADIKNYEVLATVKAQNTFSDYEGLRMNEVYQYTIMHYKENITLNKIASIAHLTPQAFCRYFKKHTRKTYVTFLNEIRINAACEILISSKYDSLTNVAFTTGFSSAISFNKVFKKIIGKSPTQYINEFKSTNFN